ncbi:LamG-like jellyroll fold domain-containing protein, partial [Planomonospora sp. ID82291]
MTLPVQLSGSAAGLPSLVPTKATTASAVLPAPALTAPRITGALQVEKRSFSVTRQSASVAGLQQVQREGTVARSAATVWCDDYPFWDSTKRYSYGDMVRWGSELWKVTGFNSQVGSPPDWDRSWTSQGACSFHQSPSVSLILPADDMLLETRTPMLEAYGTSNDSYTIPVTYSFTICDTEAMSGSGCTSSGTSASRFWKVPAGKLAWSKQYWWAVTVTDTGNGMKTTSAKRSLTTGVRQPVIGSQLASGGVGGQEVNPLVGNYTTAATDLSVAAAGPPLSVTRSYNSMDARTDGIFGAGWSTRWDMRLVREVRGDLVTALITYPDGRRVRFAANGDGSFQPPPGMYATLAEQTGGGWRLMDKSATSYLFDALGRVTKITDAHGRAQDLVYNTDGKLEKVTATGGRSLTFTWNGAHVASVSSDPVDGKAITWTYHYEGDRLTGVCAPVTAPNCTRYAYDSGSQYRGLVQDAEPYGYWRLGEASGSVAADLGSGAGPASYEGRSTGDNVAYGKPGALAASPDTAVELTGSVVNLPDYALANLGEHASVELWFKTAASGTLLAASVSAGGLRDKPMLYVGTDGKLYGSYGASATPMASAAAVTDNAWHHVTLTIAGQAQALYLDGKQIGTLSQKVDTWRPYAEVGHGLITRGSAPGLPTGTGTQEFGFRGQLDELAIYGKPLTAAEVGSHYAARAEAPHKMTTVTLPSGRVNTTVAYDSGTERVTAYTDAHGGTWKLAAPQYDAETGKSTVTVTDPDTGTLTFVHDAWRGDRLVAQTDQLGKTTAFDYDTAGFLAKTTDRNGNTIKQVNDARGNVTAITTCRTSGSCQTRRQSFHLNKDDPFDPRNDRVTASRDARSSSATDNTYATTFDYTAKGDTAKVTSSATPDFPDGRSATATYTDGSEPAVGGGTTPAGLVKSSKNPKGQESTYRYTAAGDLAEETTRSGLKITYEWDALGRLLARTEVSAAHPDGVTARVTYDGAGRILTGTAPGVKNEITGKTHTVRTVHAYDADGNQTSETVTDLTGGDAERTTSYTYDARGRVETVTGPDGAVSRTTWNHTGAQTSVTDPLGTVTAMAYTKRGELASRTLKNWTGSPVNPQAPKDVVLESFAYDPEGRLATRADAMGRTTAYTYFGDNLPSQVIAKSARLNGSTTPADVVLQASTYDAAGNLTKQVTGGGKTTVASVYDAAGRLTSTTLDPGGLARTTTYAYDAAGNVVKKTSTGAGGGPAATVAYGYDTADRMVRQSVGNGDTDLVSTWRYDERGLLVKQTDPRGNASGADAEAFTTAIRYDALGRLVEATAPKVAIEENGSAADGRPTTKYGYNSMGLATQVVDAEDRLTTSVFDKAGRLTTTIRGGATATDPPGPGVPAGYWAMDEGSGTTLADGSGGNRTATATGAITWGEGKHGKAVTFGPGTHALTAAPVLRTDESYTVSAWAYLTADEHSAVISQDGAVNSGFKLQYSPGDKKWRMVAYTADTAGSTDTKAISSRAAKLNTWTHLTGVYDAAARKIRLYEDGELVAENDYTSTWNAGGGLLIGRSKLSGAYQHSFRGTLDEVRAYAKALTAEEVRALATGTPAAAPAAAASDPATAPAESKTTLAYDAAGRITKITDPRGYATTVEYDALGNPVRSTLPGASGPAGVSIAEYDMLGEQLATVDPTGARTEATYDDLGRAITRTQIERKPTTTALTTTLVYDTAGNLIKVVAPGNKTTDYTVNAAGQVTAVTDPNDNTSTTAYDGLGRAIKSTDALGNAVEAVYDAAGRQTAAKDLDASGNVVRTFGFGYDAVGNPVRTTSAEGHDTRREFDALGRLTKLIEPVAADKAITTTFGYDAAGARTRLTDGRGHATWTAYNGLGLVASVTEPATTAHPDAGDRTWTHTYDAAGNPVSTLLPGGVRIDRVFDPFGQVTKQTGAGAAVAPPERNLTYDAAGRPTAIGDYGLEYNDRGLLVRVTKAGSQVAAYAYDALGNPTQRVDGTGTAAFTWDDGSRLKTATDPVTGRTLTYGYDKADRLTSQSAAGPATVQSYGYDALDRLTSHTLTGSGGTELSKIAYGWDKDDNLTTKTTSGTAAAGANTYGYDHAGRLTSWTAPDGKTVDYGWDEAGNRTKADDKTFAYDERNRLTSGAGIDYTYTPRGTVASETTGGKTKNLVFDAFDRMISDGEATYGYDALDRMTSRTKGADQQKFTYSGLSNDLATVTDGTGAVRAKYGRDPFGDLVSLSEGGDPALGVMSDLHGDVVATFSGTALADSVAYDPFGQVIQRTGIKRSVGYQGEYTDPDSGKVNMHARWYQPGTGGFASRDSATLAPDPSVQANRYTYGNAGPLTNIDPSGHEAIQTGGTTSAGGSGGSGWSSGGNVIDFSAYYDRQRIGWDTPIVPCSGQGCLYTWHQPGGDPVFTGTSDEERAWWEERYGDLAWAPQFKDADAKKWNLLPNGRPRPKGISEDEFWGASEETRQKFLVMYNVKQMYSADVTDADITAYWRKINPPQYHLPAGG